MAAYVFDHGLPFTVVAVVNKFSMHFKSRNLVSLLPDKIHHFNVLISLENMMFQLKTLVLLVYNVTFALFGDSFTGNAFLNHRVILRGLRLEHIIFRHMPTCLVIARPVITSLHVHGSLQLFPASQAVELLLSVTMMKNVNLQYNVSNGSAGQDVVG